MNTRTCIAALLLFVVPLGTLPGLAQGQSEVTVDNLDAGFSVTGNWENSTFKPGYYATNYRSILGGGANDRATWQFSVPTSGTYTVFGWWNYDGNRATNAQFTLNHAGGATSVTVNQKLNTSNWTALGSATFTQGTTYSITLSGQANGRVVADAIRLVSGSGSGSGSTTSNIETIADTYTKSSNPSQNQGTSSTMRLKAGTQPAWGYLKFDLSSVAGTVTSAKVKLGGHGPAGTTVSLYPLSYEDIGWGETTLTWSTQPMAGATALASATMNGSSNQWYEWDITAHALSERALGHNVISVVVKPAGSSNSSEWVFNEREASGFHPYIEVTATNAPPWTIGYIHVDHLNTPRLVADATGTTVWRWDQAEPFGNNPPDENPSGLGAFDLPLRLPGQYFDKETNNHHNYFRDYDPSLGIYKQSDPIGLWGGINTYAYVGSRPLSSIDPTGEAAQGAAVFCGPLFIACAAGITAVMASTPQGRQAISSAAKSIASICSPGDPNGNDPCEGLRNILKEHENKLAEYINNPLGPSDNKGVLGMAYLANQGTVAASIYEGRIRKLKGQIENFKKQLEECERLNGKK